MSAVLSYPRTRYGPSAIVDLSDPRERERLGPAAARGFLKIVEHWHVRDEDARRLLGNMSNGAFYELKKHPERLTDEDRLRRASLLIGIFKALNVLYDESLADRWMQLPNTNRLFGGRTPLAYLLEGGLPAFVALRRLLDARRGGA
ncbi:MAG: antitoxin Xre/MbcA/ParS toxin-binding domain-containing protein [Lautropia sp.]